MRPVLWQREVKLYMSGVDHSRLQSRHANDAGAAPLSSQTPGIYAFTYLGLVECHAHDHFHT